MEVLRPYEAEDNEVNTTIVEIIKHWAKKNNEKITVLSIYGLAVSAEMESGRYIRMRQTDGCRSFYKNVREYLVMYEEINGKSVRIKKADW